MHRLSDFAGGGNDDRHRPGSAHTHGPRGRLSDHEHAAAHDRGHPHGHDNDHSHGGLGHNHADAGSLHSHLRGGDSDRRSELQALSESFIDGFRAAEDKVSYLRLAGVPTALPGPDGLSRKLVDVTIADGFQVATASPGFGTRELVYLPFPGGMVRARTTLTFVYVSLTGRTDLDLVDYLSTRFEANAPG